MHLMSLPCGNFKSVLNYLIATSLSTSHKDIPLTGLTSQSKPYKINKASLSRKSFFFKHLFHFHTFTSLLSFFMQIKTCYRNAWFCFLNLYMLLTVRKFSLYKFLLFPSSHKSLLSILWYYVLLIVSKFLLIV